MSGSTDMGFVSHAGVARQLLLDPRLELLSMLVRYADADNLSLLGKSLARVFVWNEKSMQLVHWAITTELDVNGIDLETVLRSDSLANQTLVHFLVIAGTSYLQWTLEPWFETVFKHPPNSKKRTLESASALVKDLSLSAGSCPPVICLTLAKLLAALQAQFPEYRRLDSLVGNFFILRFVVPAVISPERLGISLPSGQDPASTKRCLVGIAKSVQTMVSGVQPCLAEECEDGELLSPQAGGKKTKGIVRKGPIAAAFKTEKGDAKRKSSPAGKEVSSKMKKFLDHSLPLYTDFANELLQRGNLLLAEQDRSSKAELSEFIRKKTLAEMEMAKDLSVSQNEEKEALATLQKFVDRRKHKAPKARRRRLCATGLPDSGRFHTTNDATGKESATLISSSGELKTKFGVIKYDLTPSTSSESALGSSSDTGPGAFIASSVSAEEKKKAAKKKRHKSEAKATYLIANTKGEPAST